MLVEWLEARQREEGLTETAFAESIGTSQPTWNRLRNGHIRPSYRIVAGALRKYPERQAEIVKLITGVTLIDDPESESLSAAS